METLSRVFATVAIATAIGILTMMAVLFYKDQIGKQSADMSAIVASIKNSDCVREELKRNNMFLKAPITNAQLRAAENQCSKQEDPRVELQRQLLTGGSDHVSN